MSDKSCKENQKTFGVQ